MITSSSALAVAILVTLLVCFIPAFQIGKHVEPRCEVSKGLFDNSATGKCTFTNTGWTPGSDCVVAKLVNKHGGEATSGLVCSGRIWPNDTVQKDISIIMGDTCNSDDSPWTEACNLVVSRYGDQESAGEKGKSTQIPAPPSNESVQTTSPPATVEKPTNSSATGDEWSYSRQTKTHRIGLNRVVGGAPRYRSWNKPLPITEEPDVEIADGDFSGEGTGDCAYGTYTFKRGTAAYIVQAGVGCFSSDDPNLPPDGATGRLKVTISGKDVTDTWCYCDGPNCAH